MLTLNTRDDLLSCLSKGFVMAELGVFLGQFSEVILNICMPKELHLVDLWKGEMCSADKDGNGMITIPDMSVVYEALKVRYQGNSVVRLHRKDTQEMLRSFPDKYFDFIYIDANHSYQECYMDLCLSYNKSNQYICGHDYCPTFQGVMGAVDRFCSEKNLSISVLTKDGCPTFLIEKN